MRPGFVCRRRRKEAFADCRLLIADCRGRARHSVRAAVLTEKARFSWKLNPSARAERRALPFVRWLLVSYPYTNWYSFTSASNFIGENGLVTSLARLVTKGGSFPAFPSDPTVTPPNSVKLVEWCAREDLNLQSFRNQILSLARLPFRHAREPDKRWPARIYSRLAPSPSNANRTGSSTQCYGYSKVHAHRKLCPCASRVGLDGL